MNVAGTIKYLRSLPESLPQIGLAILAILCAVTVLESRSDGGPVFYGRDSETITGLTSTIEVFSHGGRYVLHDFSARVPGCNECDIVEFQVDVATQVENRAPDTFNRFIQSAVFAPVNSGTIELAPFSSVIPMTGLAVSPGSPPPR